MYSKYLDLVHVRFMWCHRKGVIPREKRKPIDCACFGSYTENSVQARIRLASNKTTIRKVNIQPGWSVPREQSENIESVLSNFLAGQKFVWCRVNVALTSKFLLRNPRPHAQFIKIEHVIMRCNMVDREWCGTYNQTNRLPPTHS